MNVRGISVAGPKASDAEATNSEQPPQARRRGAQLASRVLWLPGFSLEYINQCEGTNTPQFHDEYVICCVLKGEGAMTVSGRPLEMATGSIAFINPGQVYTSVVSHDQTKPLEQVALRIEKKTLRRVLSDGMQCAEWQKWPQFVELRASREPVLLQVICNLWNGLSRVAHQATPSSASSKRCDSTVQSYYTHVPVESYEHLRTSCHRAFQRFSTFGVSQGVSTNLVGHSKIAAALDFIEQQCSSPQTALPSLEQVAAAARLSKFHFLREFSRVVGMTPVAYLRRKRVQNAAELIRTTDAHISEIASIVGFSEHTSFTRAFNRSLGMTPSTYQKLTKHHKKALLTSSDGSS